MRRRAAVRHLVVLAAAGVVLAGCGSGSSSPLGLTTHDSTVVSSATDAVPTDAVPTDAAPTDAAPTAPADTSAPTLADGGSVEEAVAVLRKGQTALKSVTSMKIDMTMTTSAMTLDMQGAYVYAAAGPEMDITMPSMSVGGTDAGPIHEIVLDDMAYVSMPLLSQETGKTWASISLDDVSAMSGIDLSSLFDQAKQVDPSQYLQMMVASGDVREVGQEQVDGVATTHYVGVIDPAAELDQLTGDAKAQMQKLVDASGVTTVNVDLWVNAQDLPIKVAESADAALGATTVEIHFSDYNVPVTITAPPASDTIDLGQLLAGAGASPSA